jgi:hypothetical protein
MSYLDDPRVLFAAERTLLAWQRTARVGAPPGHQRAVAVPQAALRGLLTSDVGLMSVAGIAFIRHMHEDEARAKAVKR